MRYCGDCKYIGDEIIPFCHHPLNKRKHRKRNETLPPDKEWYFTCGEMRLEKFKDYEIEFAQIKDNHLYLNSLFYCGTEGSLFEEKEEERSKISFFIKWLTGK